MIHCGQESGDQICSDLPREGGDDEATKGTHEHAQGGEKAQGGGEVRRGAMLGAGVGAPNTKGFKRGSVAAAMAAMTNDDDSEGFNVVKTFLKYMKNKRPIKSKPKPKMSWRWPPWNHAVQPALTNDDEGDGADECALSDRWDDVFIFGSPVHFYR